jgi:xanthine/uracil permease
MEEIKRIDEGRRWDNLIWALAFVSLLGISFRILEIFGFFGEIGIVGLIIGGAFALFLGMLNTARILKAKDGYPDGMGGGNGNG